MEKYINLLIMVNLLTACNYNDNSVCYEHYDVNEKIHIIDENNIYYDDLYIVENYLIDIKLKEVAIYDKKSNSLVSQYTINDYDRSDPNFIVDNYYFYGKYVDDYIEYRYFNIYEQGEIKKIKIKNSDKYIYIDNKKYFINKRGDFFKIDYGVTQIKYYDNEKFGFYNEVYTSLENNNDVFIPDINDKKVILKNYYDESIVYSYDINSNLEGYKYYKKSNRYFLDIFRPIEEDENSYYIDPDSFVLLEDNNLYFSYSRYLGEYESSDCSDYKWCLFSRKGSEILRFNNETKKIEQVALVPESYSVLKIYLDRAYVMDNKGIACLYFANNNFEYVYECDMKQYYNTKSFKSDEGQDINIKIYFEDKEFKNFKNETEYLSSCHHFIGINYNIDFKYQ